MSKLKLLAILPKASGFLASLLYSSIIYDVARDRNKRKQVYFRIMVFVSAASILNRLNFLLTTWPMPRDVPYAYGASGTTQTCTAAGFFFQVGTISSNLYTGTLILYYLLLVRYSWSEKRIQREALPWCHAFTFTVALGTGIIGLALKLFNPAGMWCWIASFPPRCKNSFKYGYTTCQRGDNAFIAQLALLYVPAYILFVFIAISMAMVYATVREQERRIARYNDSASQRMLSTKVGRQGVLYGFTYAVPWILATAMRIPYWVNPSVQLPFPLVMTSLMVGSLIKPIGDSVIFFYHRYRNHTQGRPALSRSFTMVLTRLRRSFLSLPKSSEEQTERKARSSLSRTAKERRRSNVSLFGVALDDVKQPSEVSTIKGSSRCSNVASSVVSVATVDDENLPATKTNLEPCSENDQEVDYAVASSSSNIESNHMASETDADIPSSLRTTN